jgi:hypothetical protein
MIKFLLPAIMLALLITALTGNRVDRLTYPLAMTNLA